MFAESLAVILQALTTNDRRFRGRVLPLQGRAVRGRAFPDAASAALVRRRHPDSAERAAKAGMNFISNSTAAMVKAKVARYGAAHPGGTGSGDAEIWHEPLHGAGRYRGEGAGDRPPRLSPLVDELHAPLAQAQHRAEQREATRRRSTARSPTAARSSPTPAKVLELLRGQLAESNANYLVCRFAFGDLSLAESLRSLELFQRHVMPALRESVPAAAE